MEELTKFDLLKISNVNPKEYLLTMNVNNKRKTFAVRIETTSPIFGVNFSDDFIYLLRNYYVDIKQLVSVVKNYHHDKTINLPVNLLIKRDILERQAA